MRKIHFLIAAILFLNTSCEKELPLNEESLSKTSGNREAFVTIKDPGSFKYTEYTWFLLADSDGKILSMTEYPKGKEQLALFSDVAYTKNTVNLFKISKDAGFNHIEVEGFIDVKKGSTWDIALVAGYKNENMKPFNVNIKNIPSFQEINVSTNVFGFEIQNLSDTTSINQTEFSSTKGGKFLVQIEKDFIGYYKFFDIKPNSENLLSIDASKIVSKSVKKNIMFPENAFQKTIMTWAHPFPMFNEAYYLGYSSTTNEVLSQYIPDTAFNSYTTLISYTTKHIPGRRDSWSYDNLLWGKFPGTTRNLNIELQSLNEDPKDFHFVAKGNYDYYLATYSNYSFSNQEPTVSPSSMTIFSTFKNPSFKVPDFATALALKELKLSQYVLSAVNFVDTDCNNHGIIDYAVNKNFKLEFENHAVYQPRLAGLPENELNGAIHSRLDGNIHGIIKSNIEKYQKRR